MIYPGMKTYLDTYKQVVLTLVFLLIATDVLFLKEHSDLRLFSILGIYIACINVYRLSGRFTFFIALLDLAMMYILFLTTGTSPSAEKAAVWLFFLLGIGMIQRLKE